MYKLLKQDSETVLRIVAASHSILGTTKKKKLKKKNPYFWAREIAQQVNTLG